MHYIVINKTKNKSFRYKGNFPNVEQELEQGDKMVIVSLYSNTIKVPYSTKFNGITEWNWDDYPIPEELVGGL